MPVLLLFLTQFNYSLNKCLLSVYYVPGIALSTRDEAMNETITNSSLSSACLGHQFIAMVVKGGPWTRGREAARGDRNADYWPCSLKSASSLRGSSE